MPPATELTRRSALLGVLAGGFAFAAHAHAAGLYPWREASSATGDSLAQRFAPPPGFERVPLPPASFAAWLRDLPLKPDGTPVMLFNGSAKPRQDVHAAVIDIDPGTRDLQQCADAVMRLRAEWLFAAGRAKDIAFTVTEGGRVPFSRWARGERPSPSGKRWSIRGGRDDSHQNLRSYLTYIFAYAGTASLEREMQSAAIETVMPGDVFIKGGFPGHAVLVADVVENATTKARRMLLLQSFMPAQDIHALKNSQNGDGSPWYPLPEAELVTPEWTFPAGSLKRWPQN